jgi:glycosyltransferase involved in cell wall biosynthesis
MQPKLSIVIPTYRRPDKLVEVLRSLINQPLSEIEIIVMDDDSGDDTSAQVAMMEDSRVKYFNLGKLGVPRVLNAGIVRSSAPYIMFLHDHDRIEPGLLIELSEVLDRNPTAGFAFCGYIFYDADFAQEQERWLLELPELTDGKAFLQTVLMPRINSPVLALAMVRREALEGELLDPTVGGCADVELWHRLASRSDVAYVRKPLIHVRGRDSASQFANARSTLDLMSKSIWAKERFLGLLQPSEREPLRSGWRKQITSGGAYVAWKALESKDRQTLKEAYKYVRRQGTSSGVWTMRLLTILPHMLSLPLIRAIRGVARRVRRSTL